MKEFEDFLFELFNLRVAVVPCKLNNNTLAAFAPEKEAILFNVFYDFKDEQEIKQALVHEGRHFWQFVNGLTEILPWHQSKNGYDAYFNSYIEKDARWAVIQYKKGAEINVLSPILEDGLRKHGEILKIMEMS